MIVVSHNYSGIKCPEMADYFLIRPEHVKQIWDRDPGKIGISFSDLYDTRKYVIELEGESKKLLARDFMKWIMDGANSEVNGSVKLE